MEERKSFGRVTKSYATIYSFEEKDMKEIWKYVNIC